MRGLFSVATFVVRRTYLPEGKSSHCRDAFSVRGIYKDKIQDNTITVTKIHEFNVNVCSRKDGQLVQLGGQKKKSFTENFNSQNPLG